MAVNDDIRGITSEVRRLVTVAQAEPVAATMTKTAILTALDRIRGVAIGPIADYMVQVDGLLVDAPPPPTPVPVAGLQGFGGSYPQHDPAKDIYLGTDPDMSEWGRHWGHDVLAPAAGTVSVYTFPTPLGAQQGLGVSAVDRQATAAYQANHAALFRDIDGPGGCYASKFGAQTMYFALLTFDTPQRLSNGQSVKAIWIGHCRGDIAAGRVPAGTRWCTVWNSGIDFERDGIPALASHAHTCGTVSGALTMNGEVSGFLVAALLGWQVRDIGTVPGPNQYMTGNYRAGKPLGAWAGRTLPPPPPQ